MNVKNREQILEMMRKSDEPSIRYSIALNIDKKDPKSDIMKSLQSEIQTSGRVINLLQNIGDGHPYSKWQGSHWVLSLLPELYYPKGDSSLLPHLERVLEWLFSKRHLDSIQFIQNKYRRCASQEGNAIYYSLALGIDDERIDQLVDRLLKFQWDDGGWNCDKNPKASHSSYHESLIPFRAFIKYLKVKKSQLSNSRAKQIQDSITNAKENFLKRELFISSSTQEIIHPNFILLHFPYYWRYNILFALKVMKEGGFIHDKRCVKALSLIESKELPTGGFPAEKKYYYGKTAKSGQSPVNWGVSGKTRLNEWVTSEVFSLFEEVGILFSEN